MLREFVLKPNEEKRIQVEGKFLVITRATGPVELTIGGTTPITVDTKDRIHLRSASPNDRAIRMRNVSGGVNSLELHTSDLLVDKRQGVDVKNEILIAPQQRIGIDPEANIVQAVIQNAIRLDPNNNTIKVSDGEKIGIDPNQNDVKSTIQNAIKIDDNQNTIRIQGGQKVGIDSNANEVKATIENAVRIDGRANTVKIADQQRIGIDPNLNEVLATIQGKVQVEDGITVRLDPKNAQIVIGKAPKRYQTIAPIRFTDNSAKPVEKKDAREKLILTADRENQAPVWISDDDQPGKGVPLYPGQRISLTTEQRLTVVGTPNDTVYLAEIVLNG